MNILNEVNAGKAQFPSAVFGAAAGFHWPRRMRAIFTLLNRPALRNGSLRENSTACSRLGTLMMRQLPVRLTASSPSPAQQQDILVPVEIGEMLVLVGSADLGAVISVFLI